MDLAGSVGIILDITSTSQVVSVNSRDSGSRQVQDGTDVSGGVSLSMESFAATFQLTGAYNEWRVKGSGVTGIFVAQTSSIYAKKKRIIGSGEHQQETIAATDIAIGDVNGEFPDYNIYTMDSSGLTLVQRAVPTQG
jgi:hypothetical protein